MEDGEARHRQAPETFWIPDLERRRSLGPGDFAKLVFRIAVENNDEPVVIERMWVLVRQKNGEQYYGVLDNDHGVIAINDAFWSGIELPFAARHVIDFAVADGASCAKAAEPPRRAWPRE